MTLYDLLGYRLEDALELAAGCALRIGGLIETGRPDRDLRACETGFFCRVIGVRGNRLIVAKFPEISPEQEKQIETD